MATATITEKWNGTLALYTIELKGNGIYKTKQTNDRVESIMTINEFKELAKEKGYSVKLNLLNY